jgi:hypothetical protein
MSVQPREKRSVSVVQGPNHEGRRVSPLHLISEVTVMQSNYESKPTLLSQFSSSYSSRKFSFLTQWAVDRPLASKYGQSRTQRTYLHTVSSTRYRSLDTKCYIHSHRKKLMSNNMLQSSDSYLYIFLTLG